MENQTSSFKAGRLLLLVFSLVLLSHSSINAQQNIRLREVKIEGNARVEEEGIRLHLQARAGDLFDQDVVEKDIKSIFRMGFFDDVKADLSPAAVLTYAVKEKPYVREVKVQGASRLGREKIETAFGVAARTILDRDKIAEGVERVKKLYSEQGYVNAQVDYTVSVGDSNQAVVLLDIEEGGRLLVKKVSFQGNRAFSESELKGLMATKPEWFLSFITNRGILDHDVLTNDMAIVSSHYYDHGYINHKIADPVIVRARDGIEVVVRVEEGEQFKVGKVELGGEMVDDPRVLLKKVQLTSGQVFRGSRLRDDLSMLQDIYADKGFAFAQVEPLTKINPKEKNVDISLVVTKGPPVYFNRVLISGNNKTRDKVIRREVGATEQEMFSANKIRGSRNALQRTGYFEDVQLSTKKTDEPDTVDLLVDVKEGPTGTFSVGGGYSSGDSFIFTASIAEKNLFGRGQQANGSFDMGSKRQDFKLNFTEPYFLDTSLSLGFDGYNTERENIDYTSTKLGFGVSAGYPIRKLGLPFLRLGPGDPGYNGVDVVYHPLIEYLRGGLSYNMTREKINNIDGKAADEIQDAQGTFWTSSITPSLVYDSRDHFFNPTEGTRTDLAVKFAGLGGDSHFLKNDLKAKWFYTPFNDRNWGGAYTFAIGGTVGYGLGLKGDSDLPLFEQYFTGGINSVRGFTERSIGPYGTVRRCPSGSAVVVGVCRVIATNAVVPFNIVQTTDIVGGSKLAVGNFEFMFPVYESFGLRGVAFFDIGSAFNSFSFGDLRQSAGVGARWMSPFGPLRVELGFPLKKLKGDDTSVLGFSFGQ
ncbi:MAG: outer membrane protein assembly factor BamA [Deltaproteobacteria bacterium RIFCSPLOWO2_12_FULL_60_19]|nr:MAG: outer membrane protein assembly factor BamA [Deltaproteobacteria bacterium RIFCSPLOWO2_12_FULL_60_19]